MKTKLSLGLLTLCSLFYLVAIPAPYSFADSDAALSAEEYTQARQTYERELELYKIARTQWNTTRQNQNSNAAQDEIKFQDARNLSNKGLDTGEAFLNLFKTRVQLSSALADDLKNSTAAKIDEHLTWITNQRNELANLPQELEMLRTQAATMQAHWQQIQTDLMRLYRLLQLSKLQSAANRINQTIPSIEQAYQDTKIDMTRAQQNEAENYIQRLKDSLTGIEDNLIQINDIFSPTEIAADSSESYAAGALLIKDTNTEIMRDFELINKFVASAIPEATE